jgi:hypothetical protein
MGRPGGQFPICPLSVPNPYPAGRYRSNTVGEYAPLGDAGRGAVIIRFLASAWFVWLVQGRVL